MTSLAAEELFPGFARVVLGFVFAWIATISLFYLMQSLIVTADFVPSEASKPFRIEFIRPPDKPSEPKPRDRVPRPPEPLEQPKPPQQTFNEVDPGDGLITHIAPPPVDGPTTGGGRLPALGEGDALPIVKVQPHYSQRLVNRGIEGYAIVEFTVTASGTTKDIHVVESQPEGVFDKASIAAVAKFKYKPRVVNGKPVEVTGMQNLFRFEIER